MGAENLFCMKSIETHARTFLALIILPIGTVMDVPFVRSLFAKNIGWTTFLIHEVILCLQAVFPFLYTVATLKYNIYMPSSPNCSDKKSIV